MIRRILIGNRVPTKYFITKGHGESDTGYHPGAFDVALEQAGICDYNLVPYSSILPARMERVDVPEDYVPGSVLEHISAVAGADYKEIAEMDNPKILTAGLAFAKVYKNNGETPKEIQGLVAEYHEEYSLVEHDDATPLRKGVPVLYKTRVKDSDEAINENKKRAEEYLITNICGMFERRIPLWERRYNTKNFDLGTVESIIISFIANKRYASAQVVMGFTEYSVPVID